MLPDKAALAELNVRDRMAEKIAEEMGVSADEIIDSDYFEVNQSHHPGFVARLRHFPGIRSMYVHLDAPGVHSFSFMERTKRFDSRVAFTESSSLIVFDQRLLEATFTLDHLTSLTLNVPSGDRLCALPWGALRNLRALETIFADRVAQGTFGFLHAVPSLRSLVADIDFFSLPCLRSLTNLTSLHLSVALPEKGNLSAEQAQERSDEALLHISKMTKLVNLEFVQEASMKGIARLAALPCLTRMTLRLPCASKAGLSVWQVEALLQEHAFCLKYLHLEFKLDGHTATANMSEHWKASWLAGKWQLMVPWSTLPTVIEPCAR